jgi:polysaccharide deacetylase 2 family uncharacterized protein YibQ
MRLRYSLLVLCLALSPAALARSYLTILIDDVGDNLERGEELVNLPTPINIAIIPYRPFSVALANYAKQHQRDVVLHMPMQNETHTYDSKGLLTPEMNRDMFIQTLKDNLNAVPGIVGVNNHMGSEMTKHYPQMRWVMQELYSRNLFFIDSRTTAQTAAQQAAFDSNIPNDRRAVFLDNEADKLHINQQLDKAIEQARQQGFAIAIGHPKEATLAVLKNRLKDWNNKDIEIVGLSHFMAIRKQAGL